MATPIGHLDDVTLRALTVLRGVDAIACEDTRVTGKLLARHGIDRLLLSYHDHNAERMRPKLIGRLEGGAAIALVSDAGTPLVSDPGFKLVRAAIAKGIPVLPLPGASAPLAALVASGLPTNRFMFLGFLPSRRAARRRELEALATVPASLIVFEAANRLAESLADMTECLGPRPAAVARELTKFYEEVRRGSLAELARHYAEAGPPKGEIVIVVGPPDADAPTTDLADLNAALAAALSTMSLRDAVEAVAATTGQPRRAVYARALALAGKA